MSFLSQGENRTSHGGICDETLILLSMKYYQLGRSGLIVSELAFGAMTFGSGDYYGFKYTVGQQEANEMIAKATDKGINFFDTAVSYANGESEIILGKALGNKRKDNLIATKIAFRAGTPPFRAGINLKNLVECTNESLTRLDTDYIDVLLLHNDDPLTPVEEVARTMEMLVITRWWPPRCIILF